MIEVGRDDSPYPGPEQVPQPHAHPTVRIISITIMVIAVCIVVVILANPFSKKAQEIRTQQLKIEAAKEEQKVIEEKRIDKYAELEGKVSPLLKDAQASLDRVNASAESLFKEIELLTHRSLDKLTATPPDVPKEIIDATRFNEDFRTPWNELLNAYTETKKLRETQLVDEVTKKSEDKQLVEADRKALNDLIGSLVTAQDGLTAQRANLDIVRRILAQRELDALSTKSGRSSP